MGANEKGEWRFYLFAFHSLLTLSRDRDSDRIFIQREELQETQKL